MHFENLFRRAALGAAVALTLTGRFVAAEDTPGGKSPETLFAELDKNKDGELTKEEVPDDKRRFFEHLVRTGDKDKNGSLTSAEFAAGFKADEVRPAANPGGAGAGGGGGQFSEEMFNRLDSNGDGKLTLSEMPPMARERLEPLFKRLGKDSLTRDELKAAQQMRPGAGGGKGPDGGDFNPEQIFARIDANGDGKISKSEVPEGARERMGPVFKKAGKEELTKDEFVAAVGSLRPAADKPGANPGQVGRPGQMPDAEEMFSRMDANGDGKLTLAEAPERGKRLAELVFKKAGKDELTKDEFVKAARDLRPDGRPEGGRPGMAGQPGRPDGMNPGFPPNSLLSHLDRNKDGRLSKEEMLKAGEVFDELDKNKDGELEPRELFGDREGGTGRPGGREAGRPKME